MARTKSPPRTRSTPDAERYAPLAKILRLVRVLELTQGMTTADLLEGQGIPRKTFGRYKAAILAAGLPLVSESRGREKVWRIQPDGHRNVIRLRQAQAVALLVQKHGTTFLAGTGFDELLEDVYRQAEATLTRRELHRVRHFDRKVFDRNDEALRTDEHRAEHTDALVSALLYDERIEARYDGDPEPFTIDPYTLLIYRKGLYLLGFSHRRGAIRTYALDRFDALDRKRGEHFDYPRDYDPARELKNAFGIAGNAPPTCVRIRFYGESSIEAVNRRELHPSQTWETERARRDGSRVLALHVAPDDRELARFILGFGEEAKVLEPADLVARIASRAAKMNGRYARKSERAPKVSAVRKAKK